VRASARKVLFLRAFGCVSAVCVVCAGLLLGNIFLSRAFASVGLFVTVLSVHALLRLLVRFIKFLDDSRYTRQYSLSSFTIATCSFLSATVFFVLGWLCSLGTLAGIAGYRHG